MAKKAKNEKMNLNPTGKGGFRDNPQNISRGRWERSGSITYQMSYFLRMSVDEIKKWEKDNPTKTRTMAQIIALNSVKKSFVELEYQKETTDRVEGKATQKIAHEIDEKKPIISESIFDKPKEIEGKTIESKELKEKKEAKKDKKDKENE